MMDIFPFLRLEGKTSEEKIEEITKYLIQFKESLEYELTNITEEKLSPELRKKLAIIKASTINEEEFSQLANKTKSQEVPKSEISSEEVMKIINNNMSQIINTVCESEKFEDKVLLIHRKYPNE